ncbi:hypothetical protein AKJ16_DCAP17703 [Drosera capensis]
MTRDHTQEVKKSSKSFDDLLSFLACRINQMRRVSSFGLLNLRCTFPATIFQSLIVQLPPFSQHIHLRHQYQYLPAP